MAIKKYGKGLGQGWHFDSAPHGLCAKGVKLGRHKTDYASGLDVFGSHRKRIVIDTLRMPDAMVGVMGGMDKNQAKSYLKSIGYSDAQIKNIENPNSDYAKKVNPKQKEMLVSFDGNDEKSIIRAEKLKLWLEEKGYAYIKTVRKGFDKWTLVYRKKSKNKPSYARVDPSIVNNPQYMANAPLRDSDKDGVPDIYDWDKDNNGVPNWEDDEGVFDYLSGGEGVFNPLYTSAQDSDQDGVPDYKDLHPFDPNKTTEWAKSHKKSRRR